MQLEKLKTWQKILAKFEQFKHKRIEAGSYSTTV
jgi:hypothetical protein